MLDITGLSERDFFLPNDGEEAKKEFLNLLNSNYDEIWISAYSFTLQPMFDALKKADAAGIKCHILLDHSQEVGRAEASKVKDLVLSMKNGDVTITTAGIHSGKPSQIWHIKGLAAKFTDGDSSIARFGALEKQPIYFAWEGSVNFSISGWDQGNTARIFCNDEWVQAFISLQEEHKKWALENEPQYQITA